MLVRRLPTIALLVGLPLVLAHCGSDTADGGSAGAPSSAGKAGALGAAGQPSVAGGGAGGSVSIAGGGNASVAGGGSSSSAGGTSVGGSGGGVSGASSAGAAGKAGGGSGGGNGGGAGSTSGGAFKLTSADVIEGMTIPDAHTCNGGGGTMNWGVAPSFTWSNPPAGTMSYAFFMIDWTLTMAASPSVNGYHSGAWNIPTTLTQLAKGWTTTDLGASAKAINGGYLGPCPPTGTDTYHMIILALPMASYTLSGTGTAGVKTAYETLKAVALGTAEITGTAKKK